MTTVNVMIRQQRTFSNPPSAYLVSALCTKLVDISETSEGAYKAIIEMYAENWSAFVRKGTTDFEREEWVKRNFKPVAKDFEALLKNADGRFDPKHQTYKNCKGVLAKCAFAMIDIDGKSLVDLKKELKEAGIGESLSTMLTRTCKALAPADEETGESKYTMEEYADAGMEVDDPTVIRRAFEALCFTMGLANASAAIQVMQVAQAGGKRTDTE